MIRSYNRVQILKAILWALGGTLCCLLAYAFFHFFSAWIIFRFQRTVPTAVPIGMGLVGLAATWLSGYRAWKTQGGLFSYHESGLYHDLGEDSAGAVMTDFYAHRVTGPAYLLGQIFLAGPLWILKSITLLKSLVPQSTLLEQSLAQVLEELRAANKWQSLDDYPAARTEILYLAQMEALDFSAHKGTPRIKAR